MIRYIIKRLLLMIPTLLVTSLLIFWAMDLARQMRSGLLQS